MSLFKCKMCGGTLELNHDETVGICEYCGTRQTLPKLGNEQKANLYERANHLRRNNEYDKAMGIYEQILNADRTDAESYWSLVLCRYGIEYVEDPENHKRIPTVNRAQFTSIFADEDYKSAIYYADSLQKEIYEHEAKAIDEIQKGILAISQKEKPFDVFICYKETDSNGRRTPDSVLATDLYHQLKQEGFKVFFSRITLEDKLGVEYEPYIFAALNSAKVMVVLGTKPEYFNAVWVKNEWSRYLALIKNGAKKMLIPAYRDMDPYDLPEEFSHLQAQDMSKLGFMQDLIRGIKKIVSSETAKSAMKETVVISGATSANAAPLLRRVFIFLEDGDFANADEYCEKVLDMEPENAEAYLGKMMAELRVRKREDLALFDEPFDGNGNYKRALRFADETFAEELRGYISAINERKENRRLESLYRNCVRVMEVSETEEEYINAAKNFEELGSFSNSAEMAKNCRAKAEKIKIAKLDAIYNNCIAKMNSAKTEADYKKAADFFKNISGYRDADEMAKICLENAEKVRLQGIYDSAKAKMAENKIKSYEQAIEIFRSISTFEDSENQIYFCQGKIEEIKAKEAEEKIERERKAEQKRIENQRRKENAKRLAKIWTPIIAGVLAFAILLNYVVIPNFDYIKAEINTMVEEAKAEKAKKNAEKEAAKAENDNENLFENVAVGDVVTFGSYEQDNNIENGAEPIEWQVLDIQNGKALVISKYGLDCQQYNMSCSSVTWETCSLRRWINNEFMKNAFSTEEQNSIVKANISNDSKNGTNSGNDTEDNVFLLSIEEAEKYFSSEEERQCEPSAYVKEQAINADDDGNCCWWLRSSGYYQYYASVVDVTGKVFEFGYSAEYSNNVARPAMWITVSEESPEENPEEEPQEPVLPEEISVGDVVTFGSYEQDNNLENGKEPIEWQVLDIQDGKALVISKYGLDSKPYDKNRYGSITWETCSLRKWLNNDFINNAFNKQEQKNINTTKLSNPDNSRYGTDGGNDTSDKVFLLSVDETEKYFTSNDKRKCEPSDYIINLEIYVAGNGTCWWWLRSPGSVEFEAVVVNSAGVASFLGENKDEINAVRPAMWVDLSAFEEPQEPVLSEEISVGDIITFGTWQQKTNPNLGKDPIEWQVLDIQDGKALVLSKYILERKEVLNGSSYNVTYWETSNFRKWLNNDFFNEAFSEEEKGMIIESQINNPANPETGEGEGKDTLDNVFLLSYEEVGKYLPDYNQRKAEYTQKTNGEQNLGGLDDYWCLRTKSYMSVMVVSNNDGTITDSFGGGIRYWGIRPAMWVDLSAFEEPQEPVVSEEISVGGTVTFGSYEQDNNLENGAEPIEWKVLDVQDGKALVISKYVLAARYFDDSGEASRLWEYCSLRKWLNGVFIENAFNAEEENLILTTKLVNHDNPEHGTDGGNDTEDKVFLLSIDEAEKYFSKNSERKCKSTSYANEVGEKIVSKNICCYWLRSSGVKRNTAAFVFGEGVISKTGYVGGTQINGVRPAMWIDLSAFEK